MREFLRHDIALGLLLQPVIANRLGGSDRLLDIAGFQNVPFLIGIMGPHAGQKIGLEFQSHGKLVLRIAGQLAVLRLDADPQQVLHMMSDLMGDHVGIGKVAAGVEPVLQFVIEFEVDVDLLDRQGNRKGPRPHRPTRRPS